MWRFSRVHQKSERSFSLFSFSLHIFELSSRVWWTPRSSRVYANFHENGPGETVLSRFPQNDSFFSAGIQCTLIIHSIVFPRYENGVRLRRRRDSDSSPFGTIGVFFYGFFPSHSQFYIRRSPRPTATREPNPKATRTHTCTHTRYCCRHCSTII